MKNKFSNESTNSIYEYGYLLHQLLIKIEDYKHVNFLLPEGIASAIWEEAKNVQAEIYRIQDLD